LLSIQAILSQQKAQSDEGEREHLEGIVTEIRERVEEQYQDITTDRL